MAILAPSSSGGTAPGGAQASLDFAPRPAARARPAGERLVDSGLKLALRLLVEGRHRGHENGATWEMLAAELEAEGRKVSNVRRLQEAASQLRRVDKVPIAATSFAGVFLVVDDVDRKLAASERVKRLRSEAAELAAFDRALAEQILGALPLEEGKAA